MSPSSCTRASRGAGRRRSRMPRRDRLNAHVRSLHQARQPGGLSLYELYGRILKMPADAISTTRLPRKALDALDARVIEQCVERVREAASLSTLVTGESTSVWV